MGQRGRLGAATAPIRSLPAKDPLRSLSCASSGRVRRSRSLQFIQREATIGEGLFGPMAARRMKFVFAERRAKPLKIRTDLLGRE